MVLWHINKKWSLICYKSFITLILCSLFFSCTEEDNPIQQDPVLEKIVFRAVDNKGFEQDYSFDVSKNDTLVSLVIRGLKNKKGLIPYFIGDFDRIKFEDKEDIVSGQSAIDFDSILAINIYKGNKSKSLKILLKGYNGLPIISIETNNKEPINSKTDYVESTIKIENTDSGDILELSGKVRGRGNASWKNFPKKPYRIKFSEKVSPFGFPLNKDWILLADYTDKSLLRTAYMSDISKAVKLDFSINYKHVELYVNDEYLGIYQMVDKVEKAKNRINIENDGFIIEDDTYYFEEPYYFTTNIGQRHYTFKYPDIDDASDKSNNEASLNYMEKYVNDTEESLLRLETDSLDLNYQNFIDLESFAKWFIVAELTGNLDPNLFYVLPSRNGKLKMMPLWDSEWSLGLACKGNKANTYGWFFYPSHGPMLPTEPFWGDQLCFKYLFKSPSFLERVKIIWQSSYNNVVDAQNRLKDLKSTLVYAQEDNFNKWQILDKYLGGTLIVCGGWNDEVEYVENWLSDRIIWFNSYVNQL